ncbi:MAG: DUF1015 domain-containing protein [Candidatus Lernaella stagnicola]|nr:DUF1015 domain-containing protein [Candidatus Lernaella stagnicola]
MARIAPFAAWRFHPENVPDIGTALAPPYDQVDERLRDEIAHRGAVNIIQLMPGHDELNDVNIEQMAKRAGDTWNKWCADNIVIRDVQPGIYYYRQGYVGPDGQYKVCKAFFALLDLEPESSRMVLPQETDWVNPRVERLKLMEATHVAAAPIFLLYSDPEREVMSLLVGAAGEVEACIDTECDDESSHTVFRLGDPELIERVRDIMATHTVILADGHHRYRTAQAFAAAHPENEAAQRILACFVPLQDDGLSILPIHRAVTGLPRLNPNDLLFELSKTFYIRELDQSDADGELLQHVMTEMARDDEHDEATFAAAIEGVPEILLLSVKNDAAKLILPEGLAEPIRDMDVALLHRLILEGPLGLDPADRSKGELVFFHEPERLLQLVTEKEAQAVFLLNPLATRQLESVADAKLKLPHKAARFYPNIPAGLVMHSIKYGSHGETNG